MNNFLKTNLVGFFILVGIGAAILGIISGVIYKTIQPQTPTPVPTEHQIYVPPTPIVSVTTDAFNKSESNYTCPKTEYVDCMPGPGKETRTECQPAFLQWAQKNCPRFKGAAL
jgi:hypothetical protein